MRNIKVLDQIQHGIIAELLSLPPQEVPAAAYTCKRCFKPNIGFSGTVFAAGDTVIISVEGNEVVFQIQEFKSVNIGRDSFYSLLAQGVCYPVELRESGIVDTNYWSGFIKVKPQPLVNSTIYFVDDICQKVILYPSCDRNLLTVVDYMRHLGSVPYELIIPIYPKVGDMVLIQGESNEDIWHGHIQSVDFEAKTVDIFFFIRNRQDSVYVRETRGRGARNTMDWQSIIGIAEGHWNSPSTWKKSL